MTTLAVLIELTAGAGAVVAVVAMVVQARMGKEDCPPAQCDAVMASPRARLAGVSNAALGLIYYLLTAAVFACPVNPRDSGILLAARWATLAAAVAAAAVSVFLLWSLMAITRRPCRICLAGNAINLFLAGLVAAAVATQ